MGLINSIGNFVSNLFNSASKGEPVSSTDDGGSYQPTIDVNKTTFVQPDAIQQRTAMVDSMGSTPTDQYNMLLEMAKAPQSPQELNSEMYAMLHAPSTRHLGVQDYYPSAGEPIHQGNVQIGNMSAPIFAYTGSRFPMAVFEKAQLQKRENELLRLHRQRPSSITVNVPDFSLTGFSDVVGRQLATKAKNTIDELAQEHGSNVDKWKADPRFKEYTIMAKTMQNAEKQFAEAINRVHEEEKSGRYVSPVTKHIINNLGEEFKKLSEDDGEVSIEDIATVMPKLRTYQNWDKYLNEKLSRVKLEEYSPIIDAVNNPTQADMDLYAKEINLPGANKQDLRTWLVTKKVSELSRPQIEGIINGFLQGGQGSIEQLKLPGESEKDAYERNIKDIQNIIGRQIDNTIVNWREPGSTKISVGGGDNSSQSGVYENTILAMPSIINHINENIESGAGGGVNTFLKDAAKLADKSGSWQPHSQYLGWEIPGKWNAINAPATKERIGNYRMIDKGQILGVPVGIDPNTVPTDARIKDVAVILGVPNKNGGYTIINKGSIAKGAPVPETAVPLIMQTDILTYQLPAKSTHDEAVTKSITGVRLFPASQEAVRAYDKIANPKSANESAGRGAINIETTSGSKGESLVD